MQNNLLVSKKPKFDFDDILIVPEVTTTINSRYKDIVIDEDNLPLMAAPMDTVVDLTNMKTFIDNGVTVVLPRTITIPMFIENMYDSGNLTSNFFSSNNSPLFNVNEKINSKVFISLGLEDFNDNMYKNLWTNANVLIDVANGHMVKILNVCLELKRERPDVKIMVGNIGNPEAYRYYAESDLVDYIRCGIGNGGGCTTTKNATIGYPMASLITEVKAIKNLMESQGYTKLPRIVADGGMKDYSDVIKSLALGADNVMIGSIFNKAIESCSPNYIFGRLKVSPVIAKKLFKRGFKVRKYFRGMSTKEAQKAMGKTNLKTSEGVVRYRYAEYTLNGWLDNFKHYLRSSMSYTNSKNLGEYIGGTLYCLISDKSYNRFNK